MAQTDLNKPAPEARTKAPRLTSAPRDIAVSVAAAVVLTALSYGIGMFAGWITEVVWLETLAVATSYSCTILVIYERRANYVIGVISTAAYAVLFLNHGLLASAILNLYLTPQLVYGWFRWGRDADPRPVTWLVKERRWIPAYLGVTAAAYLGAIWLVGALGGQMVWADAAILAGSILAQFLLDNKRIETWFVWIIVNVIAVVTYFSAGLALAGFQYVFFLGTAVLGFRAWKRSMR